MDKHKTDELKKRAAAGAAAALASASLVVGGLFQSPADLLDEPVDSYISSVSDLPDDDLDSGEDDTLPDEKKKSISSRLRARILALPAAVRAAVFLPAVGHRLRPYRHRLGALGRGTLPGSLGGASLGMHCGGHAALALRGGKGSVSLRPDTADTQPPHGNNGGYRYARCRRAGNYPRRCSSRQGEPCEAYNAAELYLRNARGGHPDIIYAQ